MYKILIDSHNYPVGEMCADTCQQIYSEIVKKLASTTHAADVDFENVPRIVFKSILHILGTFKIRLGKMRAICQQRDWQQI